MLGGFFFVWCRECARARQSEIGDAEITRIEQGRLELTEPAAMGARSNFPSD
jgi:hypothetical protein